MGDITSFSLIIGSRLDSPRVKKFLSTWDVTPNIDDSDKFAVGMIELYEHGFDLVLAMDEKFGSPRKGGKSPIWVSSMRFFAPEYCRKRKITPYALPILKRLTLPSTQTAVREQLGKPTATCNDGEHYDEYQCEDCVVRFCYPSANGFVVFVELDPFTKAQRRAHYEAWDLGEARSAAPPTSKPKRRTR